MSGELLIEKADPQMDAHKAEYSVRDSTKYVEETFEGQDLALGRSDW